MSSFTTSFQSSILTTDPFCHKNKTLSDQERRYEIQTALSRRNWKRLEDLLYGSTLSADLHEQIIGHAIRHEPSNITEIFLNLTSLNEPHQKNILFYAARKGKVKIIEHFTKRQDPTSISNRGYVLGLACRKQDLFTIQMLLKQESASRAISQRDFDSAFLYAIENKDQTTLKMLLHHGSISKTSLETAQLQAARGGCADVFLLLLEKQPLSKNQLELALNLALENGQTKVIQAILDQEPSLAAQALVLAVQKLNVGLVKDLIETRHFSEIDRADAVHEAVRLGQFALLQTLLPPNASIPQEDRGAALIMASQKGATSIVEELLIHDHYLGACQLYQEDRGRVSGEHRGMALFEAARLGSLEVTKALLSRPEAISEEHRGAALIEAAENNHRQVVQEILHSGPISKEDLQLAYDQGASI